MTPEDKKTRDAFIKKMQGETCEYCGTRPGHTAHEIFRRKKGLVVFMLWICMVCHGRGFWQVHGENEGLLRPIQCKLMLKKRPELRELLFKRKPIMRQLIK